MNFKFIALSTGLFLGYAMDSLGGELDIKPTLSTSLISSRNDAVLFGENDGNILSIEPSVRTSYKSNRFVGHVSLDYNRIQADTNNGSQSSNYTNYQYSGDISLIEEILSLRLNGQQSYRSILSSQYFVNDPYFGANNLSKTQNNSASISLTIPTRKYFYLEFNGGLSNVKSDRSTNADTELNNDNQFLETTFYQGDEFSRLSWNINSTYRSTDRSANDNLTSRVIDGNIGFGLFSKLRLVLTGRTEENELANTSNLSISDLNYDSYGAGLSWVTSTNRTITVTFNESDKSGEERETFVGLDLNWAFSSRTSVQASYGKRFFGDSGTFSFIHNTRQLRTRISYTEEITTFSQLLTSFEDLGVFVCPVGSSSFNDCFQPPSPSYELEPGEQFSNLLAQIPELSEQIILRKNLNASFGLSRKRLSSALNFAHTTTEYLESNRKQNSDVVSLTNSLQAGSRTKLNLTLKYALIEEETTGTETETNSTSIGISRDLGRNMTTNLDFRYLDRSSTNADLDVINFANSDLTDRRITLEFVYNF